MSTEGQNATRLQVPDLGPDADVMAAAFAYAKAGWYVGPLDQANKHAGYVLGKGWPAKTSRDPHQIAAWFAGTDYGVFLHVGRSGAVVFDVDSFGDLPDDLAEALADPAVPFQSTREDDAWRGHYLYTVPAGRQLGNARGELRGSWGEIRGRNGIIVVQPTVHEKHAKGARYQWERIGAVPVLPTELAAKLPDALSTDDAATDAEVQRFIGDMAGRARPQLLRPVLDRFAKRTGRGESRHETALGCAVQGMKEARAGYYPARDLADQLRQAFLLSLVNDRDGRAEFEGILSWATAQAMAADLEAVRGITDRQKWGTLPDTRPAPPRASPPSQPAKTAPPAGPTAEPDPLAALPADRGEDSSVTAFSIEPDGVPWPEAPADAEPAPPVSEPRRHSIDVTQEPAGIVNLTAALDSGAVPGTYVRDGHLVRVSEVSGVPGAGQIGPAMGIEQVDPDVLRRLLAQHSDVFKWRAGKLDKETGEVGPPTPVPCSPSVPVLKSTLTASHWPNVPALAGVISAPVLRPDGTLLQEEGYDLATGLYYSPSLKIPHIPDQPTQQEVDDAYSLLFDEVLVDFPWAGQADRTNYVGLLMTPILRPYVGGLTPLGAISATDRGSGKTLLTNLIGRLFGMTSRPWVSNDDELRKAITAVLGGTSPVVLFDNVGEHDSVSAPSLAKLLTSAKWDDRLLGTNTAFSGVNDRLWMVTGNQIEFGGDIAQRSVLVGLDPKCERPDLRSGFVIEDLEAWLDVDENRVEVIRALLILARGWISDGGHAEPYVMRGFTRWATAMGGFLLHYGLGGFLSNRDALEKQDDEAVTWSSFLSTWFAKYGRKPIAAAALLKSAEIPWGFSDPWDGTFITRQDGKLPSARGLGKMLAHHAGRFYGEYRLERWQDKHSKMFSYAPVPKDEVLQAVLGEGQPVG